MFLTYNGINLSLVSIDRVNRDTILSEDGTTVEMVETTLSVSGIYHTPIGGVPNLGGTSVSGFRRNRARRTTASPASRKTVRGADPATNAAGVTTRPRTSGTAGSANKGGTLEPIFSPNPEPSGTLQPVFVPQTPSNQVTTYPPLPNTSGPSPKTPTSCSRHLPDPGNGGWAGPINTDRELELYLRAPRRKLLVWAFDQSGAPIVWIESPRRNAPSDARTGPVVLNCSVRQGPNGNSFFVGFDIRTWLTPCEDGSDRPLLSHRWQMTHTEDENHYLTRVVRGTAVFDLGNLLEAGQNPDWFRKQLFHPIPFGFRRRLGPVTLSSDGAVLNYEYSDTDQTITFDPWDTGATQLEIHEKVHYYNPWRGIS